MKPQNTNNEGLSDAELLAFLLRSDHGLAHDLLARFGTLRQVLHTDPDRLVAEPGVGTATAATIRAVPELARRYFATSLQPGQSIRSPADTETYLKSRLGHLGHELFCCLFLDNRHRVLRFDELFRGTIDGTSV